MANICNNVFFATSEDNKNLEHIKDFILKTFDYVDDLWIEDDCINAYFDSRWVFPEEIMKELYDAIPNKDDIYMRCLSFEYGSLYHALWVCDGNEGWNEV